MIICPVCGKAANDLTTKKGTWALVVDERSRYESMLLEQLVQVVDPDAVLVFWRHQAASGRGKKYDIEVEWHLTQLIRELKNFDLIIVAGTDAFRALTQETTDKYFGLWTKSPLTSKPLFAVPSPEMVFARGLGEIELAVDKLRKQYGTKYARPAAVAERPRPISAVEQFGKKPKGHARVSAKGSQVTKRKQGVRHNKGMGKRRAAGGS